MDSVCAETPAGLSPCIRAPHRLGLCTCPDLEKGLLVRVLPPSRAASTVLELGCGHASAVVEALPDLPVRFCPVCRVPRQVLARVSM